MYDSYTPAKSPAHLNVVTLALKPTLLLVANAMLIKVYLLFLLDYQFHLFPINSQIIYKVLKIFDILRR